MNKKTNKNSTPVFFNILCLLPKNSIICIRSAIEPRDGVRNALWRRTPRSVLPRFSIFYGGTPACCERGLINIANQPECRPWHVEKCRSTCLVRSLKSPDSSVVTKQFKVFSIPIKSSRKTVADSAQTLFYPYSQLCFQPLKIMTIKKCIHKDINRVINS